MRALVNEQNTPEAGTALQLRVIHEHTTSSVGSAPVLDVIGMHYAPDDVRVISASIKPSAKKKSSAAVSKATPAKTSPPAKRAKLLRKHAPATGAVKKDESDDGMGDLSDDEKDDEADDENVKDTDDGPLAEPSSSDRAAPLVPATPLQICLDPRHCNCKLGCSKCRYVVTGCSVCRKYHSEGKAVGEARRAMLAVEPKAKAKGKAKAKASGKAKAKAKA